MSVKGVETFCPVCVRPYRVNEENRVPPHLTEIGGLLCSGVGRHPRLQPATAPPDVTPSAAGVILTGVLQTTAASTA